MKLELEEFDPEMGDCYLQECFTALNHIKVGSVVDSDFAKIYERNFIINMAVQYGKLLAKKEETHQEFPNLISAEIGKEIGDNDSIRQLYEKLFNKTVSKSSFYVYPDFLIHESFNVNETGSGQHLIIEAKTSDQLSAEKFAWDLLKLNAYVKTLKYTNAVYLIIGHSKDEIESKLLNKYVSDLAPHLATKIDNIKFIIKPNKDSKYEVYTLTINTDDISEN